MLIRSRVAATVGVEGLSDVVFCSCIFLGSHAQPAQVTDDSRTGDEIFHEERSLCEDVQSKLRLGMRCT